MDEQIILKKIKTGLDNLEKSIKLYGNLVSQETFNLQFILLRSNLNFLLNEGGRGERIKHYEKNETVGLTPEDQSKVEPVEESCFKKEAEAEGESCKEIEANSEEKK